MRFDNTSQKGDVTVNYNQGLRSFFIYIYRAVSMNLGITFLVSYLLYRICTPESLLMLSLVGCIGSFVTILYMGFALQSMSVATYKTCFYLFSFLEGLGLIGIYYIYTFESIVSILLLTTSLFCGLSMVGYTTEKKLDNLGGILIASLWGLIIFSFLNLIFRLPSLGIFISVITVLVFLGFILYDTQKIKQAYYQYHNSSEIEKFALFSALNLYLDFINLFIHLLHLFGKRKSND